MYTTTATCVQATQDFYTSEASFIDFQGREREKMKF